MQAVNFPQRPDQALSDISNIDVVMDYTSNKKAVVCCLLQLFCILQGMVTILSIALQST